MKGKRQQAILDLIGNQVVITQEELQSKLEALGFQVTQSTVSRDIKELRLIKSRDSEGQYRYLTSVPHPNTPQRRNKYREMFSGAVMTVNYSLNNVVVKCHAGTASGACVAVDAMFGELMLGSLAGDDTIIIVTAGVEESALLADEMKKLL